MTGYTKLFSSILDSTVWGQSTHVRVVWVTLLAKADQYGEVHSSVPGLARAAIVSREQCEEALEAFLAPDPDSRSKEFDGRRIEVIDGGWRLLNHAKYRGLMTKEERQAKKAEYMREYRKRNPRVTHRSANVPKVDHAEADSEADQIQKQKQGSGAHAGTRDLSDSEDETPIPLDLLARAEAKGVFTDMLAGMPGVTGEQLRAAAGEFVSYWTIGAGMGKRRRLWMAKLREHLRKAWSEGRLRANGVPRGANGTLDPAILDKMFPAKGSS